MKNKITLNLFTLLINCSVAIYSQQIYTNGSISTGTTATNGVVAPNGFTWSLVQRPNISNGFFGHYITPLTDTSTNYSLADDFTVPVGETWSIASMDVFCYQTNATELPVDVMHVRIWNGDPSLATSTVVAGDITLNALNVTASGVESVYRAFDDPVGLTASETTRRVWRINGNISATLTAGTYWVEYQAHAINNGVVLFVPVTILNTLSDPTWNAKTRNLAVWDNVIDANMVDLRKNIMSLSFNLNGATVLNSKSNEFDSKVSIYPNPVENNITVFNPIVSQESSIEIFDITGRLVQSSNSKYDDKIVLDVKNLKSGNYIVKLKTENGIAIKKVIKL